MEYEDVVEEKDEWEDDENIKCPFCGKSCYNHIMRIYTGFHERETMIHCDNCDNIWIVVYKFSHVIKLNKEIVNNKKEPIRAGSSIEMVIDEERHEELKKEIKKLH